MTARVLGFGAALVLAAASGLASQVEPVIVLRRGYAETAVANSGRDTIRYAVELLARTVENGAVVLGRRVSARLSPASFRLAPGERQVLRVQLHEAAPTPTLGLAVTMSPNDIGTRTDAAPTETRARLVLVYRLVAKVVLAP